MTAPVFRLAAASAQPMAIGMVVPTTADEPSTFTLGSIRCIEPPLPRAQPVSLPYISASIPLREPPLAR